jgi:metal-responsive CopG/Arc/MetJ family transcriptional regulator
MGSAKVAITIDDDTLQRLDRLVKEHVFPNRSKAIQEAVQDKIKRLEKSRLARECAKLNPSYEQALADEGISEDVNEWPEY